MPFYFNFSRRLEAPFLPTIQNRHKTTILLIFVISSFFVTSLNVLNFVIAYITKFQNLTWMRKNKKKKRKKKESKVKRKESCNLNNHDRCNSLPKIPFQFASMSARTLPCQQRERCDVQILLYAFCFCCCL